MVESSPTRASTTQSSVKYSLQFQIISLSMKVLEETEIKVIWTRGQTVKTKAVKITPENEVCRFDEKYTIKIAFTALESGSLK